MIIKVLHVLWNADFGGIERLALNLASAQSENPEISAGILFGKEEGRGEFLREFQEAGLKCHFLRLKSGLDFSPRKLLRSAVIFRYYDILHFHGFNPLTAVAAILSRRKIVFTVHGVFGFGRKRRRIEYLKDRLEKAFLNKFVDFISFNSKFSREIAEQRFGLKQVIGAVVHNGIRLKYEAIDSLTPNKEHLELMKGKFIVGTSSRLVSSKRIDRLIEAFSIFENKKEAALLLVGDGIFRNELNRMVKDLSLDGKAIFAGFQQQVRKYQAMMDVCVFPFANEAFGLVAIETLSLGKPTIVFRDGGGIAEILEDISKEDIVENVSQLASRLN
jgi:glycosyltransferase involved in cell wall biosynthesis